MKNIVLIILFLWILNPLNAQKATNKINLAGQWNFATDPSGKGINEQWFTKTLTETIVLPGSMSTNGKGNDLSVETKFTGQIVDSSFYSSTEYAKYRVDGNIKFPFWLQSLKYYVGPAWYQKDVFIPKNWKNKHIQLFMERCHWETRVWVDGNEVGMQNSLGTPHVYNLSEVLTTGKHKITVCVDNRIKEIDPGINSHSISDHTQTNWNGIVGDIHLSAKPITIQNIQIFPDILKNRIYAKIKIINPLSKKQKAMIQFKVLGGLNLVTKQVEIKINPGLDSINVEYPMGKDVKLWSEFHPHLYTFNAKVITQIEHDTFETNFGMREIKVVDKQLTINGKPLFLRGTLECAIFPKTGFPPIDKAEWLRIYKIARAHGLNHFRFHSWCPPKVAFDAADELGFYLQVEVSSWANAGSAVGDGKPIDEYVYAESRRMVTEYGNHPSFCILLYGNEPAGKNQNAYLSNFVSYWKNKDNRRIYSSGAGWPNLDVNDFLSTSKPRIQGWGQGLKSIINSKAPASSYDWVAYTKRFKQPIVSHEIGQWCVYPNFKEIKKYTGVVRAKNFEIFKETLKDHGMLQLADSFLLASGKLQALCYKADIEAALRTKDFGGFQLLDLHDFPGQGTALVGVLDPFWDEKGYITPQEYSRFCNVGVPLARLKKHIYINTDTLSTKVEVAYYGDEPLKACVPSWKISDVSDKTIFSGKFQKTDIPLGNCFSLGQINVALSTIQKAEKLVLEVSVGSFSNSWDIWVYPAKKNVIAGVENIKVVSELDSTTQHFLKNGGSVLLTLKKGVLKPEFGGKIAIGFSSIFWNTAWTKGQAPHTLGILCNPQHPAFANFPTEYHSNWQWWDAMSHSDAIMLSPISPEIKPIVRVIDDWFTNRPLALLFEVKIGKGKLLVSGIDFNSEIKNRQEAQQLLYSLKKYMLESTFNPTVTCDIELIKNLYR
jgi:hypothetical protein